MATNQSENRIATSVQPQASPQSQSSKPKTPTAAHNITKPSRLKWVLRGVILIVLLIIGIPYAIEAMGTVSTDDAYVNGHVTLVAPRVPGQVARVFVEDNNRIRKGDLLVQLDREPFETQVNISR